MIHDLQPVLLTFEHNLTTPTLQHFKAIQEQDDALAQHFENALPLHSLGPDLSSPHARHGKACTTS